MWTPKLKTSEINHIKTSRQRCTVEQLSSELGRAKTTVKSKIDELKENERISNISKYAKRKKIKLKRRVKGGV